MRIKNWDKFQHYKDRNPVWIKLHKTILDDPEYHSLSDRAGKYLPLIWLIASEDNGNLPSVEKIAFRLRINLEQTKKVMYELKNYVEQDDSNLIATCTTDKIREEEIREDKKREREEGVRLPFDDPDFIQLWQTLITQPKWKNKTTASLQQSLNKLERWGLESAKQAIEDAIAGNWQGLFEPRTKPTNGHTLNNKDHNGTERPIHDPKRIWTWEDYQAGRVPGYDTNGKPIRNAEVV